MTKPKDDVGFMRGARPHANWNCAVVGGLSALLHAVIRQIVRLHSPSRSRQMVAVPVTIRRSSARTGSRRT